MNRFGKITSGILLGLILIGELLWWFKHEEIGGDLRFRLIFFISPIILGIALRFIFRKRANKNLLQWLPNGINVIGIILSSILISTYFDPLTNYDKTKLEQKHLEKTIQKWIKENAYYPDSYHPIYFIRFWQDARPKIIEINDPEPIGYTAKENPDTFEFAYYFIEHAFVLKSKSGTLDSLIGYFRLSPNHVMKDIRLDDEKSFSTTINIWREKYGNNKRNLELEINGNTSQPYYFRMLDTRHSDNFSLKLNQFLLPYSNGRLNGIGFRINDNGDTISSITFKDGKLIKTENRESHESITK